MLEVQSNSNSPLVHGSLFVYILHEGYVLLQAFDYKPKVCDKLEIWT